MEDIGLFRQAWKWVQSRKQAFSCARARDRILFLADRHWPMLCRCGMGAGRVLVMLLLRWWDCVVRGFWSLTSLGYAALFLVLWSCFISFSTAASLASVLLGLGAAVAAIHYLGYTPGLFIVGLFGILVMWICGNFWVTGMLLIVGGYMFSINHARLLIFMSTAYAVYYVNASVGWLGVLLSLNLSFISNDFLNKLLQGYDGSNEGTHCEEQKESEPPVEDFSTDCEYSPPTSEAENVAPHKSFCEMSSTSSLLNTHKGASSSKVLKTDASSLDEIKRIMESMNHYDALGLPQNRNINLELLKREYRTKARLVHPDKNMGSPLASESFKKLQTAYEVLSDSAKRKNYDEKLKKSETGRMSHTRGTTQQEGVNYRSEESRRIDCTKCDNSHIWICTNRCKARARWCQDCSQYHQARDGDGWVEIGCSSTSSTSKKVEIPRAFVCAESKIFDVSEWAICQGMECRPNTHRPSFHVNMVGLDKTVHRSNPSRFPWGLDAEMMPEEDEFDLWLQQALASGLFSESPKRRKSWSPFKIPQKGMKPWRRSP